MACLSRIAALAISMAAWLGLAVQFDASLAQIGSVGETLWVMLRYFTIIINLLAAIAFTGIALGKAAWVTPARLGGLTLSILLVGIVYALLLDGLLTLSGGAKLADVLLHRATPVAVPLYWLAYASKGALTWRGPAKWTLLPLGYFLYAMVRGAVEGEYAYPFLDVAKLGWGSTLGTVLVMALAFLAAGYALVWLDRRLAKHGRHLA